MPSLTSPDGPFPTVPSRAVGVWLLSVMAMIFAMVVVGGVTRLTGSGLSMVQWHPLMGAVPPMSDTAWQQTFAHYQQSPQYLLVNSWMTLADFKAIFLWEFGHRLLGRLIGVVVFVPLVFFAVRRSLSGPYLRRCIIAFLGGGAQGLLGWYMVKSGLVDVPEVSHFRLAAHLSLALVVLVWIWWIVLDMTQKETPASPAWASTASWGLVGLVALQIVYGAFMAGLRAGVLFNTFPDMNGSLFPTSAFELSSLPANALHNPVFVHAFHRSFAWVVGVAILAYAGIMRSHARTKEQRFLLVSIVILMCTQITLGAFTVIWSVPVAIATAHQAGAVLLLLTGVALAHRFGSN